MIWPLSYAVDAVPCRIAFERGKERHFCFLAISLGESGWVVLAEELPLKQHYGVVRVAAPLAGSNVCYSSTTFCALFPTLISNLCETFIAIALNKSDKNTKNSQIKDKIGIKSLLVDRK